MTETCVLSSFGMTGNLASAAAHEPTDEDLLRRIASGDRHALGTFSQRHADTAYRVALRCTGNAADAEDAVQSAFLILLSSDAASRFQGYSSVKGWLMSIIVNTCRNQARTAVRRKQREESAVESRSGDADGNEERVALVLDRVKAMPEEFRLPIWMHYLERLSFREVGEALGLSEDAAKKRVNRGLDKLRETLSPSGISAVAVPDLLAVLPTETAPAALVTALSALGTAAHVGSAGTAAASAKISSGLVTTAFKVAAVAALSVASVAGAIALKNSGSDVTEPQTAKAAKEESPAAPVSGPIKPQGDPNAPLGSETYYPSPERPVGWRGDGSGRFPGATPPLTWSRSVKGFYPELTCQGGKLAAESKAGALLNMGYVQDWMIVGPFDTKDFATGLDEEMLKNEPGILPQEGEKVGDKAWMKWTVSPTNQSQSWGRLVLDFAFAYDKKQFQGWQNHPATMQPWLAYAQTCIWSPAAGKVILRIEGSCHKKAWLNGVPIPKHGQYEMPPILELKQGWNNLVLKILAGKEAWNCVTHVAPAAPFEYETKNIQWMTRMPGDSWCSPIIVGNKIFVSADANTLVCLDKADGKVLWMRSTTVYHTATGEEQKQVEAVGAKAKQLDDLCEALPAMINASISPDGSKADKDEPLHKKIKQKVDLEGSILAGMTAFDKKRYTAWGNDMDTSKYNPVSDGTYVYAAFGGGNKGLGGNVLACFDLNGKRIWNYYTGQTGIGEHGTHCSPALCGDFLVFKTGMKMYGFEKLTGKVAWEIKIETNWPSLGASPVPVRVGKDILAYLPQAGIFNPATGAQLWKSDFRSTTPTPCVVNNMIYGVDTDTAKVYFSLQLPDSMSDGKVNPTVACKTPWKELSMPLPGTFSNSLVGSPLFDNGLMYVTSEGGALSVFDAKTGKTVYNKLLDSLNPRLTWVFVVGICTGPTLGGKRIYQRDDQLQTIVIEPGGTYKELARNQLYEYDNKGKQPESQSNFFFEGNRIYFRSRAFLYCIGEK